jgi:hypothetical protein
MLTPNPQGFKLTIRKRTASPPGIGASILPLVLIGYASNTTGLPIAEPAPIATPSAAQTAGGTGPLVEHAAYALGANGGVSLVHMINAGGANPGTYGSITQSWVSADAPVASADSVIVPDDDFGAIIEWTAAGVLGTAGAKYKVSLDGGFSYFSQLALGTATTITLPHGGGKINLVATLSTLLTRAADVRIKFLAHAAEFGAYHGVVDPASPYTVPTPIDEATLYTCCTALRTSALTHVGTVAGVHGAADTTATTAITSLSTPTTLAEAQAFLIAFVGAFFGDGSTLDSGHTLRTASAIHTAQDVTNTLAANMAGVITVGDKISFDTHAPTPDASQIVAAIQSLREYNGTFGTIAFSAPITGALAATIKAEIESLWEYNKFADVVAPWRLPTLGETAAQYSAALDADLAAYSAVDMRLVSGGVYIESTLLLSTSGAVRPLRPPAWWVSVVKALSEPETLLSFVEAPTGVFMKSSLGKTLPRCLDEQSGALYSVANRTIGMKSNPMESEFGVYITQDVVLYAPNSDWILGPYTSVMNHGLRFLAPYAVRASKSPNGFASPPAGPLTDEVLARLSSGGQSLAEAELVDKGRCTEVLFQCLNGDNATFAYSLTIVPNFYPFNGATLDASVSSVSLTRTVG